MENAVFPRKPGKKAVTNVLMLDWEKIGLNQGCYGAKRFFFFFSSQRKVVQTKYPSGVLQSSAITLQNWQPKRSKNNEVKLCLFCLSTSSGVNRVPTLSYLNFWFCN